MTDLRPHVLDDRPPRWVMAASALLFLSAIILPHILAFLWDDYSSVANYLSELGAVGAPYSFIASYAGFLSVAVLSFILLVYSIRRYPLTGRARIGAWLVAIGVSSGYLLAVLFPCDLGCPVQGSARQAVHNLGGLIQYPLGAAGFFLLALSVSVPQFVRGLCALAGLGMLIGFVMMVALDQAAYRGAWQRLGDYLAMLAIIALALLARRASASSQ